jgi:2',3'-cyclic-nucleotide 2'-phosphodiesterase (5'-nucleotidase family)
MFKFHRSGLVFLLFTILSCAKPVENVEFYIVQLNDVYEVDPINNGKNGGLARVAWVIDSLKNTGISVYTVLAGDFISPSFIGTIKSEELGERIYGMQMIEALNATGINLVTFGNHEFDIPEQALRKRMDASEFEWTSANVKSSNSDKPFGKNTHDGFISTPEFIIHDFKNKTGQQLKLGVISVTIPFNKATFVSYENPFDAIKRVYPVVRNESDITVFLTHLDYADDVKLAELYPSVSLIMGGHDHTNMEIKTAFNSVTKADANAKTIYIHKFIYNFNTKQTQVFSELKNIDSSIPSQKKTQDVVNKWISLAEANMKRLGFETSKIITKSDSALDGLESSIRNGPTNLGKIIANSMKNAVPKADLALLNSGSIRLDDVLIGTITQTDIFRVLPYGGKIVTAKFKGKDLEKILAIGLKKNKGIGGYLQTSGVSESTSGKWLINGKSIVDTKNYTVVLSDFLASGKEANFDWLKDFTYSDVILDPKNPSENDIRQIVINYILEIDAKKASSK